MAETKPIREPRLGPTAFEVADYKRTMYRGMVERGIGPEDVINPAYWAYHAAKLKPWDRVELCAEDGTWFGEYLVLGCDRTWARLFPLRVIMLTTAEVAETQAAKANGEPGKPKDEPMDHEIRFRGPAKKWSVIRKSDGAILAEGMTQKQDAEGWLNKHLSPATAIA